MQVHAITYNVRGLPWSSTKLEQILAWCVTQAPPILCFQEVFTSHGRTTVRDWLERNGYTVLIPCDEGVSLFPSGLVTAVRTDTYTVIGTLFQPYLDYHNVELFANKGFHRVSLQERSSGRTLHIVNTHTQSDEEILIWTPYAYKKSIRHRQAAQLIAACEHLREPVLVIGDFNQESSLHANLRTLHPPSSLPLKKATFFRTGEDLDHVAWMPLQWSDSLGGCGFCGEYGPRLEHCKVHTVAWSDHAPVEVLVRIPALNMTRQMGISNR